MTKFAKNDPWTKEVASRPRRPRKRNNPRARRELLKRLRQMPLDSPQNAKAWLTELSWAVIDRGIQPDEARVAETTVKGWIAAHKVADLEAAFERIEARLNGASANGNDDGASPNVTDVWPYKLSATEREKRRIRAERRKAKRRGETFYHLTDADLDHVPDEG